MFSNRQQSIPKIFIDKMEIDRRIEETISKKVVALEEMTKLIRRRGWLRDDCARMLQRSKSTEGGATA